MSGDSLLRIDSGYYVAGVILNKDGICIHSSPIVRWMRGKAIFDIKKWLDKKKFKYTIS